MTQVATRVKCIGENCGRLVTPDSNWRCPECGESCEYDGWAAPCDRCGQPTLWRRVRHKTENGCKCKQPTPDQVAKEAEFDRLRLEREEQERQRFQAGQNRQIQLRVVQDQQERIEAAAKCYADKGGKCTVVPYKLTRRFCGVCVHILKPIKEVKRREPRVERPAPAGYRPPIDHPKLPVKQWKEIDSQ